MNNQIPKQNVQMIRLIEIGDDRRISAKAILDESCNQNLTEVLVIGRDDNGELWALSSLNSGQSLWLLEKMKERILDGNPWSLV